MKKEFRKIWQIAIPYQDKRDDGGHARIVTEYATKLCEIENANDKIVIPSAILHDIGWSQLSKKDRFLAFNHSKTLKMEYAVRIKHQEKSTKLAKEILNETNYPQGFYKPILEIISQHDTRKGFISNEDGSMRDADKLWRYSKIGFEADLKRNKCTFDFLYNEMIKKINEKDFFFFESAKNIAKKELKKRKKEFIAEKLLTP